MNLSKPQKLIYDMEKVVGGSVSVICGSMLFSGDVSVCAIKQAINEIYRINDALRIRIFEGDGCVSQTVTDYIPNEADVLQFADKDALGVFAEEYAKEPLDFYGKLSEFKIILLPNRCGVLVKLHHIIGDAWTLSLIGNQINALLHGETPEAFSYTDYLETENTYLQSKRYEKDGLFFRDQFRKCDEVTYLSEKQSNSFKANRKTFVICADDAKRIADYAAERKTSAFVLFTSALATYMNRVKMNAEKFYIGTAVLNRATEKEKNTVGMYINTVPMLIELSNNESFAESLSRIEDAALSVFRHQKYNYGDVLADLRKEYGFGEKLYDVIISYQNATVTGDAVETTWYPCGFQVESLQIHIDDRDNAGIFRVHYDYLEEKYTAHEIERLHAHLMNLLFGALADNSKKTHELDMLTADERQKLFVDFNDTAVDYPRDKCIHALFEEQVEKIPDKVAVIACDKTLTYKELNEEANRIAHALIEKGVGVGDIVAFALPRKSYLISAILGILKSGAAYLPIDLDYPQDRIEYMLTDSKSKSFITDHIIYELLDKQFTSNPNVAMSSVNLCYCIYTSGSTGLPKGAIVSHRNLQNHFLSNTYTEIVSKCHTAISLSNAVFDMFVNELFSAILFGQKLVLTSELDIATSYNLASLISENEIETIICTPTKFSAYLCDNSFCDSLKSMKVITFGGESLTAELCDKIHSYSDAIIINGYGPTETTIVSGYGIVVSDIITIGKPIANTQIYIVDSYMNPTPIGVTGELCIAGDGVGAGYLNRPELTAEKFINNPFGEGKLYKTGDLAYWCEDGNIVYVGRNDFQVKIRGLRIELGEIESAISSVDGISQSVVIVRKNNEGRQMICAFYTGIETDPKEIRAKIGKKLPKYMLPHIFTHMDVMPLTTSGKINRNALPEVDLYALDSTVEYIAPQTEKEKVLASAIAQILKIEAVGLADDFFNLGGDSLKAIELISKLDKQGYHTDTKTIFACDTVKELAEKLTAADEAEEVFDYPADIPATPAQMRVYTAQSMNADSTMYNVPYVFRTKEVEVDRLQKAINALLERHEILRTCFENKDGTIIQVVDEKAVCNVEQLASDDILAFVRPFDLTKAPLIRVGVYENTVMIDMHHIVTDGGSMPVFLRELNELYMGRTLDTMPVPYKRFAVTSQDYTDSEKYWLEVYKDEVPELTINTDFKRGQKQSFNGSAVYETIDIALHEQIQQYCKKQNITPYVFYMAAFNILLSEFSGCEDIVVGMPISGRDGKYLDTIGMFVNTIALRNKPVGTKTVEAFLQEVKENSIAAIEHQDYPFGQLVKKLGLNTADRNPLFDVMFAYQSEQMTDIEFGDKKAELLPISVTTSKYDFTFNILPREDKVVVLTEYCMDLYSERTIQRFVAGFKQVLKQMLSGGALKELSVILPDEMQKLLYTFNDTAADYPREKCVHTLFEEQVEKTPDKTAVIARDKTLTYGELNTEANRIAHSLIAKGIGVGDIVAFALPRKSYLISTIFGILKSGAAYLPIDPDYPQERIDYMLSDSKAKLCISAENITELLQYEGAENPSVLQATDHLCYCIYTSGSTGKPKGTLLTHKNVSNYIVSGQNRVFGQIIKNSFESILSVTTVGFDIFVTESLLPLANGLSVVLADETQSKLEPELNTLLENHPVDVIQTTPTRMRSLIVDSKEADYLKHLKAIILGGESLDSALVDRLHQMTNAQIYNTYGPTETTVWATNALVSNSADITIGKPIANTQIYILNSCLQIVPIGVTGELCIAGDCVGDGYLNRPELTAESFIDNPFGKGKLYKTGDLAYWREDGNIVYVGRNDFQVKIRGQRIELGEIESAISSVNGISQSVVIVRKNNEGRQLICAFYSGAEKAAKEIRSAIGESLPKYMLPHVFMHMDSFPLTSSGKIDRNALPEVDLNQADNSTEYIAPVTDRENRVADILARILDVKRIGIEDDFFELGCDSLKAIEFISECHYEGIYFDLQSVFDHPTISSLLQAVDHKDQKIKLYERADFEVIDSIIFGNRVDNIPAPVEASVGNVLLTGATGYLGAHLLADFLEHDTGRAYCIVRGKDNDDSKRRLDETLRFYFDEAYVENNRIVVLRGDLTKDRLGLSDGDYQHLLEQTDTVINSVASVKHYGSYAFFFEANVKTVENLIRFCKASDAKLIHISTTSVAGNDFDNQMSFVRDTDEILFTEHDLYIGQPLDNVYIRSKFEAEKAVLDAMADGLKANIMRMGNLTNRRSDGRFQKNHESNAFLNRIRAIVELGCLPDYLLDLYTEFTPIDEAAAAVMTITRHFRNDKNVFHVENPNPVSFRELHEKLNMLGMNMRITDSESFGEALRQTQNDPKIKHIYETIIRDLGKDDRLYYDSPIRIDTSFTDAYLHSLGFAWHKADLEYISKYFDYFKMIRYIV